MRIRVNDRVKIMLGIHKGRCASVLEVYETGLLKIAIPFSERPWWMIASDFVALSDVISELGDLAR